MVVNNSKIVMTIMTSYPQDILAVFWRLNGGHGSMTAYILKCGSFYTRFYTASIGYTYLNGTQ